MKKKSVQNKLSLNKTTITTLQMEETRGGIGLNNTLPRRICTQMDYCNDPTLQQPVCITDPASNDCPTKTISENNIACN